jgi:hypothetical protein
MAPILEFGYRALSTVDLGLHEHRLVSRDVHVREEYLQWPAGSDDVPLCFGADSDLGSIVVFRDSLAPMKKEPNPESCVVAKPTTRLLLKLGTRANGPERPWLHLER